ncbi:hypothetical protein NLU13_6303 [Sarocladium strictum]|uniref:Malic acid transport protein n=1 Tax=Sarocladium strictum TaxID=5046 RepID=A0AA39GFM9_SARSR|nr:hypothetical protein NLU13_6303 [Sarocladium strictum]
MEERDIPFFSHAFNQSSPTAHLALPAIRQVRSAPSASFERDQSLMTRPTMNGANVAATDGQLERQETAASRRRRRADTSTSLGQAVSKAEGLPEGQVSIKDRIACYRWTFFTMTMATGGMANVLHSLQYSTSWIRGVGVFFCILNITLFLTNCVMLSLRFYLRPGSFTNSFTDQVDIGIILINACEYGIPRSGEWLLRTMEVLFWAYVGLSVIASAGLYLILWSTLIFPIHMMTPTWVFPAYPLLLTAPLASNLIESAQKSGHELIIDRAALAFGAATTQGTGCLIAFMISAAFMYRLMTQKLPRDMQRPGVVSALQNHPATVHGRSCRLYPSQFISIGPFGFTAAGIAKLGSQADSIVPPNFLDVPNAGSIIKIVSLLVALWLWGLSMWFFLVSVGSLWKYVRGGHSMPFQMTWWSFVFPNTALVTATEVMGRIFDSKGILLCGSVMTACLIVVWIIVFITMIYCLRTKKLLWPKDDT